MQTQIDDATKAAVSKELEGLVLLVSITFKEAADARYFMLLVSRVSNHASMKIENVATVWDLHIAVPMGFQPGHSVDVLAFMRAMGAPEHRFESIRRKEVA